MMVTKQEKIAFSVRFAKFSHWNSPILAMHWFGKLGLLPTLHEIAADEGQIIESWLSSLHNVSK